MFFQPMFNSKIKWFQCSGNQHEDQHFPDWPVVGPVADIGKDEIGDELKKKQQVNNREKFNKSCLHFDPAQEEHE